ncbi:Endonuclease/exonuclease/phosphatase [Dimargaris cristalligena]|uniref:Endonuclease/exonuclease/phosphatase n=1 Tax=Dimargaris cristalligena TaxID=215637 RepID=A0A4P9ZX24_9FUNG|nr:Endonuclease/exonuclease/phosphatase [Dimargaris cristalligena]|eukprot:RKP38226.1 Endonuclease/exonuclease/phosphatase [Dimargaris cristalligena]
MTYNVLAPSLAPPERFPASPVESLDPGTRRRLVLEEIAHFRPSILCLQEVEDLGRRWSPRLRQLGYHAESFKPRRKSHGCCIAWQTAEWKLRRSQIISLTPNEHFPSLSGWCRAQGLPYPSKEYHYLKSQHGINQRLQQSWRFRGSSSAALAILESKSARSALQSHDDQLLASYFSGMTIDGAPGDSQDTSSSPVKGLQWAAEPPPRGIVVATCHLHWDPAEPFVRLLQLITIFDEIRRANRKLHYPVILAGDFNTVPDSPLYRLFTSRITGEQPLSPDDLDQLVKAMHKFALSQLNLTMKQAIDLNESPFPFIPLPRQKAYVQSQIDKLVLPGQLYSAYAIGSSSSTGLTSEPQFTTYCDFVGTLDYIMFTGAPQSTDQSADSQGKTESAAHQEDDPPGWLSCLMQRILNLPPAEQVKPGIPSALYPSDHLSLMAEFSIRYTSGV